MTINETIEGTDRKKLEYLRHAAKQKFEPIRSTWIDCGRWALPHRVKWLQSQSTHEGERNNHHIIDPTHIISLRSYVAGFLEGNTSATRPWYKTSTGNSDVDMFPKNHVWLDIYTRQTLKCLSRSNFYSAAGLFYYDFGVFNTGTHFVDEIKQNLFFHTLTPGSYYVINNAYGEAVILVREFSLSVKALVDMYGKDGKWDNISDNVRNMYERCEYGQMIDICQIVKQNDTFDPNKPSALLNKKWISYTYETGTSGSVSNISTMDENLGLYDSQEEPQKKYLKISSSKRKPFIVGKSDASGSYEYGEKGPTLDALGLIKSLNKKAIGKDQALEQMLRPAMQGPANLRKSYISHGPGSYIPLDVASQKQGLRSVFEINPAIGSIIQDVTDLRQQIDKLYYADYLLYLTRNPKTRTATETNAIMQEQQLVIGPNLQSLNHTYNTPIVEFVMDFVLDEDPELPPPPEELQGRFLRPEFISVFAQAQKAADLPSVDRYLAMVMNVGQLKPEAMDKLNVDKLCDLYEDRLYLPAGLNNPQQKVEAIREQQQAMMEKQKQMEAMVQMAGAAKDVGLQANQNKGVQ